MGQSEVETSADHISKEMHTRGGLTSNVLGSIKEFYKTHSSNQKAINEFNRRLSADAKDILGDVTIAGLDESKQGLVVRDHGKKRVVAAEDHQEAYMSDILVRQSLEGSKLADDAFHTGPGGKFEMDRDSFFRISDALAVLQDKYGPRPGEAYSFLERLNEHLKPYNIAVVGLAPDGESLVMRQDGKTYTQEAPPDFDR